MKRPIPLSDVQSKAYLAKLFLAVTMFRPIRQAASGTAVGRAGASGSSASISA